MFLAVLVPAAVPPRLAKGKTGAVERPEDDPLAIEAALPAPHNPAGLSSTLSKKHWPLDHSFRGWGWRWQSKEASLTGSAIRGSRSRRYFRYGLKVDGPVPTFSISCSLTGKNMVA